MKSMTRRALLAVTLCAMGSTSFGQQYPDRPITVAFGFPAGTILDTTARLVTDEMAKRLGQPFVFQFRPGASATIAAKFVAGAPADGHTLFYSNVMTSHPIFVKNNAVDPLKEMVPVSLIASAPYFLFVRSSLPVRTVQELIAYDKANPGKLTFGTPQPGIDLAFHMFKSKGGILPRAIPYKSAPQIAQALLANEVDMTFMPMAGFGPHVQSGKIRPLLFANGQRSPSYPDVPASPDVGFAGFELGSLYSLWAPAGTPADVVQTLAAEAARVVKMPAVSEQLRKVFDAEPIGSTPEESQQVHRRAVQSWAEAARLANFTPQ